MKNSPFTLSVRLCLSCGPEHPTPTRHESGSLVNRTEGKVADRVSSTEPVPLTSPRGLGGGVGHPCQLPAVLHASPFHQGLCLAPFRSHTDRNSVGLSEQAPRPSPRHESLGADALPRPLAASPPLFWFGCHGGREEPVSLRLRGPSPLPSATARPGRASPCSSAGVECSSPSPPASTCPICRHLPSFPSSLG